MNKTFPSIFRWLSTGKEGNVYYIARILKQNFLVWERFSKRSKSWLGSLLRIEITELSAQNSFFDEIRWLVYMINSLFTHHFPSLFLSKHCFTYRSVSATDSHRILIRHCCTGFDIFPPSFLFLRWRRCFVLSLHSNLSRSSSSAAVVLLLSSHQRLTFEHGICYLHSTPVVNVVECPERDSHVFLRQSNKS